MSWIVIVWAMMASACVTVGLMHLVIWLKQPSRDTRLYFVFAALSVAVFAAFELMLMRAGTVEEYATLLSWAHVPIFVLVVSIVAFVRRLFGTGRLWLAWAVCGLRLLALMANFFAETNASHGDVTALKQIEFWGETITLAQGAPTLWIGLGQASSILLVVFMIDASIALWRRNRDPDSRRRALVVGGGIVFFVAAAAVHSALLHADLIATPYVISAAFLGIVLAMAYELGFDVIRSGELAVELRASEAHTREIESRMELAVDAAGIGTWEWDIAHDDIRTSDRGRSLLGFATPTPVGLAAFLEHVSPIDRERVRKALHTSLENGLEHEMEFRVLSPDASLPARWMFTRGRIEHGIDGKPMLMRGVVLDITQRRQLESEALQQRNELTHLSRVAMLGELSGSIAHELNQPLAAILSNAQAAQRFLSQDKTSLCEVRQILKDIVDEDKRAGELIRRLRILFKKGEIELQPLDANELVRDVLRLMRSDLINRRMAASSELTPQLPEVCGDRVQLQQVLLNLLINAADSTPGGASDVHPLVVRTTRIESGEVRISVSDRGTGIPPADLQLVFEPFMTTKAHGMGLGLTVCRTIMHAHRGRIWAENNAGRGATFHISLPATR